MDRRYVVLICNWTRIPVAHRALSMIESAVLADASRRSLPISLLFHVIVFKTSDAMARGIDGWEQYKAVTES